MCCTYTLPRYSSKYSGTGWLSLCSGPQTNNLGTLGPFSAPLIIRQPRKATSEHGLYLYGLYYLGTIVAPQEYLPRYLGRLGTYTPEVTLENQGLPSRSRFQFPTISMPRMKALGSSVLLIFPFQDSKIHVIVIAAAIVVVDVEIVCQSVPSCSRLKATTLNQPPEPCKRLGCGGFASCTVVLLKHLSAWPGTVTSTTVDSHSKRRGASTTWASKQSKHQYCVIQAGLAVSSAPIQLQQHRQQRR